MRNTHHRHNRHSLGNITDDEPQFYVGKSGTLYTQEIGGEMQKASMGSIPKNTYGIPDSKFQEILALTDNGANTTAFNRLISSEQKSTNATTTKYGGTTTDSTGKITISTGTGVKSSEQIAQEARDKKVTDFNKYAKAGGLLNDFNALFAKNTEEIKANQEQVFAQDPKLATKFAFNQTSGVYEPKAETKARDNTLLYAGIAGGAVVVGTVIYFITQKKK